jgi:predicted dehydrogenase
MNTHDSSSGFSRRDFMKGSVLAAGGVLLSGLPVQATGYVKGSDALKIALIGCGGRGTGAALEALKNTGHTNVQLVAMADAFRDRLDGAFKNLSENAEIKAKVKVTEKTKFTGFDGYKNAIALADVVILATPPGFRPIHFEEAVKQGKHVFMEKPVATDAPGVRQVLAAAEEAKKKNLKVVVGLQRHYQNSYLEALKRVQDGALGDIVAAQVFWNSPGVWVKKREEKMTEMEYQMRNWYYFNWLCGDHINEQHIHNIDVGNWFKGAYPVKAQGTGGRQVRTGKEFGEIFDHHCVEFEFADGTVMSSQCRHFENTASNVSETIIGAKGRLDLEGDKAVLKDWKGNVVYRHRGEEDPNPYQTEHDVLFAAIKNNTPLNDAENGAKSTMTAILGRMATYSGQVITWDEALNSQMSIMPKEFTWTAQTPTNPGPDGFYPIPVPGKTRVL